MAQTQVQVKVRDISKDEFGRPTILTGTERTMTYKSYLELRDRYELIAQIDDNGNPIAGNPNLKPEDQEALQQRSADAGSSREEEVATQVNETPQPTPIVKERKKPGPKPKNTVELQEDVA